MPVSDQNRPLETIARTAPHAGAEVPARLELLISSDLPGYELLDSGEGRKLERFGTLVVDRPEPQAVWSRRRSPAEWGRAAAVFAGAVDKDGADGEAERGRWAFQGTPPESWLTPITAGGIAGVNAVCRFGNFWHLGLFPEQHAHWQWMLAELASCGGEPRVLNLFAYTGVASLLAAAAGAKVTHVDASRKAIAWAKENQSRSSVDTSTVRWIVDDARKFVERELRRGRTYHGILIDPPKFGRGPGGEVWDLYTDLAPLLRSCVGLLEPSRAFLILTCYAIRASALSLHNLSAEVLASRGGSVHSGELAVRETGGGRVLATSLYARWSSHDEPR